MRACRTFAVLVIISAAASCKQRPATQYLVHLETNVPALVKYQLEADGAIKGSVPRALAGETTFGLVSGGDHLGPTELVITGLDVAGGSLGRMRRELIRFEPERTIDLYLCFDGQCFGPGGCAGQGTSAIDQVIDPSSAPDRRGWSECAVQPVKDAAVPEDSGLDPDAGEPPDSGHTLPEDTGPTDSGFPDRGFPDAEALDAQVPDAEVLDADPPDAFPRDSEPPDSGTAWAIRFGGSADANDRVTDFHRGDAGLVGSAEYTGSLTLGARTHPGSGLAKQGVVFGIGEDGFIGWSAPIRSTGGIELGGLVSDSAGTVYVAGAFSADIDYAGSNQMTAGGRDAFLVEIDSGMLLQHRLVTFGAIDEQVILAIALDEEHDRLIIGGGYRGNNFNLLSIGPGDCDLASIGDEFDGFVASIDRLTMLCVWAMAIGSDAADYVRALAVGDNGEIYVAGDFSNVLRRSDRSTGHPVTGRTMPDIFFEKLSRDGTPIAETWIGNPSDDDIVEVLAPAGDALFVGGRWGFNTQQEFVTFATDPPYAIILDTLNLQYRFHYSATAAVHTRAVSITSDDTFAFAADVEVTTTLSDGSANTFTFTPAGQTCGPQNIDQVLDVQLAAGNFSPLPTTFGGEGDDEPSAIVVLPNGDHLIAGRFSCRSDFHGIPLSSTTDLYYDSYIHRFTP